MGLVPCYSESTGKRNPSETRKGNKSLRSALLEASQSVCRSDNYLGALYRLIAARNSNNRCSRRLMITRSY
ncbi:IS110 family transposase [Paenibacillus sp. Soil724D2]|uniref:IS110 family transposase n=1 Tax=Paenibacillus sp. (strain Soil724D2) TaxID=1736392 RepID=UPI001F1BBCB9|nr:IS110 family transposase [Paenibacillus sp. Soil724D2]